MIIFLDTNIVIYTVEQNMDFGSMARSRLAMARAEGNTLMISDLTRMECLVGPLKLGDAAMENDFYTFFKVTAVAAISAAVCDRAARIRAKYNFKPMDALQIAASVENGAGSFLPPTLA